MKNYGNILSFCFGCEPLGGTDWGDVYIPDIEEAIQEALDLGIKYFDTAAVYGLGLSDWYYDWLCDGLFRWHV